MPEWEIQRLNRQHDRANFDCGHPSLNAWLRERAGQFDRKDFSRTFVAVQPASQVVLGYYALSNHRVLHNVLPPDEAKGLPRLDVPVVLLGRLAVDHIMQGRGLGSFLLIDALRRTQQIADQVGVRAIEVDAIDETARSFYVKFGFCSLLDDPSHLYLPIQIIRKLNLLQ
jgi:GNAT superfamily N-acetyltransferase